MNRRFYLLVLLFTLLASTLASVPIVRSHQGTIISEWALVIPRINGLNEPGQMLRLDREMFYTEPEWGGAPQVDFTLTRGAESHPGKLWVRNDCVNLYLGVEIIGDEYDPTDTVFFLFDNDHDGVREAGDNCLGIMGENHFKDLYVSGNFVFEDPSARDGAGAAIFKDAKWFFELAYPLNSTDYLHDFSLKTGSTVGFGLVYMDEGLYGSGWPTYITNDWTQMANIEIPALPPANPHGVDLTIDAIEISQAVQLEDNSLPLVKGKSTVARAYVGIGKPSVVVELPIDVSVYLFGFDGGGHTLGVIRSTVRANPGHERANVDATANFRLPTAWRNRDRLILKAFARPISVTQFELDYSNNWLAEQQFDFFTRRSLTINIVPVNVTWANPQLPTAAEIHEQEDYLKMIYPLSTINFVERDWRLIDAQTASGRTLLNNVIADLNTVATDEGISPPNQIFGLLPQSSFTGGVSDPTWDFIGGNGVAACGARSSVCHEATMAHEINHNLGPGTRDTSNPPNYHGWGLHTWTDQDWPYYGILNSENDTNEFGITTGPIRGVASTWGWPPIVTPTNTPEVMSYDMSGTLPTQWISPYRWSSLFNRFSTWSKLAVATYFRISGHVTASGTARLDPAFRQSYGNESLPSAGDYCLVLLNESGMPLSTHYFTPRFVDAEGQSQDVYHFTKLLPYYPGVARIMLVHYYGPGNFTVLDTIQKSPTAPQVTVLSPNGGETWQPGVRTISWAAQDLDNDTLTYRVYFSPDAGTTWKPISPNLNKKSFQVDASLLKSGSNSLIRVVASDGFNTAEDVSNAFFTVADKPPTARILSPANGSTVAMQEDLLLQGVGSDPDDGVLNETAYSWTSDVDGFLGYGSEMTAMLTPGTHCITLAVTDSANHSALASALVNVIPDIYVQEVQPFKTIVGELQTMRINVTVKNQGLINRGFNLSVIFYNGTTQQGMYQTQTVAGLGAGNTITLQFNCNITMPKGLYSLHATAWAIKGRDYQVGLYAASGLLVTIPGDAKGDRIVNVLDLILIANHLGHTNGDGHTPYSLDWYKCMNTDIKEDGAHNVLDLILCASHLGQHWQ